ncbi:benzoate 4-monooxygenase cytochrome P450 [Xylariaceae sp. FL1272]|nr:benzoate 4-monooxygenase cytochrome P450 [Xylariaceae sp. FL1272]
MDSLVLPSFNVQSPLILLVTSVICLRVFGSVVYNLFFHPNSRFPGPKLAAISNVPYSYWFLSGRQPFKILHLHLKYGPAVRVAPNELSFNSATSWKDIYGIRPGHKPFIKSDFYDGGSFANRGVHSIVSERDVDAHSNMRKYLSSAFSDRALSEQESLITESIDKFIELLPTRGDGYDIGLGFEMLTFDIIGDLAFGESFGAIESAEPHPWIAIILGALKQGALVDVFKRFPTVGKILSIILRPQIQKLTRDTSSNEDMAIDLVQRRMGKESPRKDFLTRLLADGNAENASALQLAAHASDFVIAGSETTATALATVTYHMLRNVDIEERLRREVRGAFNSYEDIDGRSTQQLPYLKAVILEAMRIYPPLPFALPRVVPDGGDTVDGHFLAAGTVVSINPFATCLDSRNFELPHQYIPERWLGENKDDMLDASQPFSMGTRSCMGRSLGLLELRLILAKLIWRYDMDLADSSVDWLRDSKMQTLWQKPDLKVKIREVSR